MSVGRRRYRNRFDAAAGARDVAAPRPSHNPTQTKQGDSGAGAPALAAALSFSDTAPSWEQLAELVRAQEAEHGVSFTAPDLENVSCFKKAAARGGALRIGVLFDARTDCWAGWRGWIRAGCVAAARNVCCVEAPVTALAHKYDKPNPLPRPFPNHQGPTHPLALKRTFGSTEPIRVKLYRDHAAWCPYCQKVWLQLEEKRIPYGGCWGWCWG